MLYRTCTTITSVDLAHYGVSRAENRVSVDCGKMCSYTPKFSIVLEFSNILFRKEKKMSIKLFENKLLALENHTLPLSEF